MLIVHCCVYNKVVLNRPLYWQILINDKHLLGLSPKKGIGTSLELVSFLRLHQTMYADTCYLLSEHCQI